MRVLALLGLAVAAAAAVAAAVAATPLEGCYVDCDKGAAGPSDCNGRILPHVVSMSSTVTTAEWCSNQCKAKGFALSGVEAARACFCGNTLVEPANPKVPNTECCAACAGNDTQTCGAVYRIFISETANPSPWRVPDCPRAPTNQHASDPRSIFNGTTMLTDGYLDQPYCATYPSTATTQERWLCTITSDDKGEGTGGEHVVSIYSDDAGRTWSKPVSVEPPPLNTKLANAYSMTVIAPGMSKTGGDRAYAIYNMNLHNVTSFPGACVLSHSLSRSRCPPPPRPITSQYVCGRVCGCSTLCDPAIQSSCDTVVPAWIGLHALIHVNVGTTAPRQPMMVPV